MSRQLKPEPPRLDSSNPPRGGSGFPLLQRVGPWKCDYCGGVNGPEQYKCPTCGAPMWEIGLDMAAGTSKTRYVIVDSFDDGSPMYSSFALLGEEEPIPPEPFRYKR